MGDAAVKLPWWLDDKAEFFGSPGTGFTIAALRRRVVLPRLITTSPGDVSTTTNGSGSKLGDSLLVFCKGSKTRSPTAKFFGAALRIRSAYVLPFSLFIESNSRTSSANGEGDEMDGNLSLMRRDNINSAGAL